MTIHIIQNNKNTTILYSINKLALNLTGGPTSQGVCPRVRFFSKNPITQLIIVFFILINKFVWIVLAYF